MNTANQHASTVVIYSCLFAISNCFFFFFPFVLQLKCLQYMCREPSWRWQVLSRNDSNSGYENLFSRMTGEQQAQTFKGNMKVTSPTYVHFVASEPRGKHQHVCHIAPPTPKSTYRKAKCNNIKKTKSCSLQLQSQCRCGGLPWHFGSGSSTGWERSICASFNQSMDTVSARPPISIKNVFDPVCLTFKGPKWAIQSKIKAPTQDKVVASLIGTALGQHVNRLTTVRRNRCPCNVGKESTRSAFTC